MTIFMKHKNILYAKTCLALIINLAANEVAA